MLLGIIIGTLIVGLALYDHFSTRNWQVVTSDERNDVVFEKRNKAYGAYQIRRDYNKRVFLILFLITAGFGGLYGAAMNIHHKEKPKKGTGGISVPFEETEEKKDEVVEEKKVVEKATQATEQELYKFDLAKILDPKKNEALDTMEIPDPNKQAGLVNTHGKNPFSEPGITPPTGNVTEPSKTDSEGVVVNVSEIAIFKGGRQALVEYLTKALPDMEGNGTCKLKFIVNEEGKVTKVWVKQKVEGCPECDEAAIKAVKNMPEWEPAKLNGDPVASYFYLPIVFRY